MTAVKRFRSAVILHRPSPTVRYGALGPPVGGTFHFENLLMPPLPNTCPKMVPSDRGGSLCVKDAFAKKIFGAGRDSAGGALASVLQKHSTEDRTGFCRFVHASDCKNLYDAAQSVLYKHPLAGELWGNLRRSVAR